MLLLFIFNIDCSEPVMQLWLCIELLFDHRIGRWGGALSWYLRIIELHWVMNHKVCWWHMCNNLWGIRLSQSLDEVRGRSIDICYTQCQRLKYSRLKLNFSFFSFLQIFVTILSTGNLPSQVDIHTQCWQKGLYYSLDQLIDEGYTIKKRETM